MNNGHRSKPLQRFERRYAGPVYVGVAASDYAVGRARDSIHQIELRPGDSRPQMAEFTKGMEAREYHTHRFLEDKQFAFILHLDGDMQYPTDLLERLRSHHLPCVSGLYYRRTYNPMIPIWYEDDPAFRWPMMPFRAVPQPRQLYRLGATGAGCWLIHRRVYEAVEPILKGEAYWWQDDMDVWPHDLEAVLEGRDRLRPLRGVKSQVGADIRLGFFIRTVGYAIWGDAEAKCDHFINYPLSADDWRKQGPAFHENWSEWTGGEIARLREEHMTNMGSVAKVVAP